NLARRETSDGMLAVAERMVEQGPAIQEEVLTVYSEDWSPALLGIVAGRLAKLHGVPVVAATLDEGGVVRASARSVPGLDIIAALDQCKHLLCEHGGHSQAAGFSTTLTGLKSVHAHLLAHFAGRRAAPRLEVDLELTCAELSPAIAADLELLAPFGAGNPEPVLGVRATRPREVRAFGKQGDHLGFVLSSASGVPVEVIGWGMASQRVRVVQSESVDLIVRPLRQQNGSFHPLRLVLDTVLPSLE
ncbi:MAG: DHHA1 domain-containing protein, partial [Chloroflexota bacterium]|nr:DHHA1 domain-containing protein [Chloroflexota bacterium]